MDNYNILVEMDDRWHEDCRQKFNYMFLNMYKFDHRSIISAS